MEQPEISLPTQYCLYARKSSESDEKQALSIDSQIKEMQQIADRDGLYIKEIRRESHSAKASGQRPEYNRLIEDIRAGKFTGILTWAPDRLSRNAGDLGSLVDLMDQKLLTEIRTYGQKFTNSPNEKFLLMILGSQAKLENDNRGLNVKRGLRTRVEMGLWPGTAPTGYLNEKNTDRKCHILVDNQRAPVVKKIFEKIAYEGWTGRQVYSWLKDELNFKTKTGKYISLSNVYLIVRNTFYYGMYEYPRNTGNWYTGKHTPLVSKELYDQAQVQITKYNKGRTQLKEFAFTKMMTCGQCKSGITADEKFKKLKDGSVGRYVYYGCTRSKDLNCKEGFITEDLLIQQFTKLIDELGLDELGIQARIRFELEKHRRFQEEILGVSPTETNNNEFEGKKYAKFILKNGTSTEKRDLLFNLQSKLLLKHKELEVIN